jgi:hypothetical protein
MEGWLRGGGNERRSLVPPPCPTPCAANPRRDAPTSFTHLVAMRRVLLPSVMRPYTRTLLPIPLPAASMLPGGPSLLLLPAAALLLLPPPSQPPRLPQPSVPPLACRARIKPK